MPGKFIWKWRVAPHRLVRVLSTVLLVCVSVSCQQSIPGSSDTSAVADKPAEVLHGDQADHSAPSGRPAAEDNIADLLKSRGRPRFTMEAIEFWSGRARVRDMRSVGKEDVADMTGRILLYCGDDAAHWIDFALRLDDSAPGFGDGLLPVRTGEALHLVGIGDSGEVSFGLSVRGLDLIERAGE